MSNQVTNPYVGPRTFTRQESDRFFGREREARDDKAAGPGALDRVGLRHHRVGDHRQQCTGRDYTAMMSSEYAPLCRRYASELRQGRVHLLRRRLRELRGVA